MQIRTAPMNMSRRVSKPSTSMHDQHPFDKNKDLEWRTEEILGPDMTDNATVINLAKMTSDAYILNPDEPDWLNTTLGFNYSRPFGWNEDGLRGHVFTDKGNKTVIVAFKGSTVGELNSC